MAPPQQRKFLLTLVPLVLLVTYIFFDLHPREEHLRAAPHTISRTDHPYDPDWPDVLIILTNKCAGCHRRDSKGADLSSYNELLNAVTEDGGKIVIPGRPHESPLLEQVAWNVHAQRNSDLPSSPEMPDKRHEWLSAGQLATIERWIANGALEYRLPEGCSIKPLLEIDFPSARQCAGCHPKQYGEWSGSMHAYAQHSPVFEAFNSALFDLTGGTSGTFCSRCHTPTGTALGEGGSRPNVYRSRISMEGVTCISCHRRRTGHYKSNGRSPIEPGKLVDSCLYGPFEDGKTITHESQEHPYIRSSQFCGECHDVTNPRGVRLEEAFSEWLNSPAAKQGITCQQCHMGPLHGAPIPEHQRPLGRAAKIPGVSDEQIPLRHLSNHSFVGPDYSMLPDTEFPYKLDWMYETDYRDWDRLTPHQQRTLTELRQRNRKRLRTADENRYELLTRSAELTVSSPQTACVGQKIKVRADVTSKVSGHNFPTGFTAERQAWVSITVRDPKGEAVFTSGDFDDNGDLRDEHSHAVLAGKAKADRYLLSFQNKFIMLGTKGTERSSIVPVNRDIRPLNVLRPATNLAAIHGRSPNFRLSKSTIPPLQTIGRTYPIHLPNCPGRYTLQVKLNFRHLPPVLLDTIGVPHLKSQLEVVVIDQYESVIHVQP